MLCSKDRMIFMKYYNMGIDEVIEKLQSNSDGLSKKDVDYRLKKYGNNVIKEKKKKKRLLQVMKLLQKIILLLSMLKRLNYMI